MTEQEQKAVHAIVVEATMLGFDEGIRTAAAMVRASADHSQFLNFLRLKPQAALDGLAAAIEDANNNKPPSTP